MKKPKIVKHGVLSINDSPYITIKNFSFVGMNLPQAALKTCQWGIQRLKENIAVHMTPYYRRNRITGHVKLVWVIKETAQWLWLEDELRPKRVRRTSREWSYHQEEPT